MTRRDGIQGPFALLAGLLFLECATVSPPPPVPSLVSPAAPSTLVERGSSLFGTDRFWLPTGTFLTPDAAPGSRLYELDPHLARATSYRVGGAVASELSPDGATLLVLTSGFNRIFDPDTGDIIPEASPEWIFVYDVSGGLPREAQVIPIANTFGGLVFHPRGNRFFVSGGSDDLVRIFARDASARWSEAKNPVRLGHRTGTGGGGLGMREGPYAAGMGLSPSGRWLGVANYENDSLSIVDTVQWNVAAEIQLSPGRGAPGGEFPIAVVFVGESRAFVTSQRDREVVEIDLGSRRVARRIRVGGEPTRLVANASGTRLYVANANSDTVSVLDADSGTVEAEIPTAGPSGCPALTRHGSNPNSVALSPDGTRLYVTNGGNNTVAVVDLASKRVVGLIPTGFYPTAVAASKAGPYLYVVHAKSATGPNPRGPWSAPDRAREEPYDWGRGNQYTLQLTHAGLLALPVPDAPTLEKLTRQAEVNNRFDVETNPPTTLSSLRGKVNHVIFVVGENRTYDQILGDLAGADGDPGLTLWGDAITPNHHALARTFVTLDRFFDAGGVSGTGWQWTTAGRTTDVAEKMVPVEYALRGRHTYDWEGTNRNVNVSWPTVRERQAANPKTPDSEDLLPGTADVAAVDGPDEGGPGFLWDAAIAAGLEVRNYGFFCDTARYSLPAGDAAFVPLLKDPSSAKVRVAFPARASLHERTDPYFRGFDMLFADRWREAEWEREFDAYVEHGDLPALELVRLPHDHLGAFDDAADGLDTPDTQMADNDYALGRLVEKVSRSRYWSDTVIVALEDDSQNGCDHVDAHRSFALFAGGHVKRGSVVSTTYSTPSVLRTIELLLGLSSLSQADAFAPPMVDVFDAKLDATPFVARVPPVLRSTRLPLPVGRVEEPRGDARLWSWLMRGQDFRKADALDTDRFNRALACGISGVKAACSGLERPPSPTPVPASDD